MGPLTLFEKIWRNHLIAEQASGEALLYVDLNLLHEGGSFLAFDQMRMEGRTVRRPGQNLAITDHYLPTLNRAAGAEGIANPDIRNVVQMLDRNAREFGIEHIGMHDPRQGITHVIGPELGITQPGLLMTCCDSHTATHGAMGALAVPIGQSNQLRHVLCTQTVWQKRPKLMRIRVDGVLPAAVSAKDVALAIIARIGIGGAVGHAIEYAGSTIRALSMEGRMTICNMSIEWGARVGMVASDETTFTYLKDRPHAPRGAQWDKAVAYWRTLRTDDDATFDAEIHVDASNLAPLRYLGYQPGAGSPP